MDIEKDIEKALVKEVKLRRGMACKLVCPGIDGMPDRLILFKSGRIGFCELKKPGEKPRALQLKRKAQLEALGFKVFLVDSKDQIGGVLSEIQST